MYKSIVLLGLIALSGLALSMRIAESENAEVDDASISTDVNHLRYLYVPDASTGIEIDFNNHLSLEQANIQPDRPVVITIDGFLSNTTSPMTSILRTAYTNRAIENLIILDWSMLSGSHANVGNALLLAGAYLKVLGNVGPTGHRLAQFLELLESNKGIPLENVHLVGGSLGAHIAGAAGSYIRNKYGSSRIGRITGLDPAGPFFNMQVDRDKRLHSGDAQHVEVYHSNRGQLGDDAHDTADVNVYLNGGNNQPGCAQADKENSGVCSHGYSFRTFRHAFDHSVLACPCTGNTECTCNTCQYTCDNPIQLGPDSPSSARGRYHLTLGELSY